jgi:hypothetical protein
MIPARAAGRTIGTQKRVAILSRSAHPAWQKPDQKQHRNARLNSSFNAEFVNRDEVHHDAGIYRIGGRWEQTV